MQAGIERAIAAMWDRYDEQLTLAQMADTAVLSRSHFTKVFRALTGTSPGRFLSAIRLFRAKNLLLETALSVTDISYRVGYNSLGTFTSRFTDGVGVPPTRYRALVRSGLPPQQPAARGAEPHHGAVHGVVRAPNFGVPVRIYVGAFSYPIAQGIQGRYEVLESGGPYRLTAVPEGRWHICAAAVALHDSEPLPWNRRPLAVASSRAIHVRRGRQTRADLTTHPTTFFDPPILLALPELDSWRLPLPAEA